MNRERYSVYPQSRGVNPNRNVRFGSQSCYISTYTLLAAAGLAVDVTLQPVLEETNE